MALIVQKYGGQILSTPEKIKTIAQKIKTQTEKGDKIIAVVSAMGASTDGLIDLAYQVSNRPIRRELDMLLSVGERISMSLLSMALNDLGISAKSFTGSQSGILTENDFTQARILEIKPIRIQKELQSHNVIIIAGFQGVSEAEKEITTLGRGGTDTTAVAMAYAMQADKVEILKEVGGIYSADPKLVKSAVRYSHLPYAVALEACYWGAKILHYRAVELAKKLSIPIEIQHIDNPGVTTLISNFKNGDQTMLETKEILTISSQKNVAVCEFETTLQEGLQNLNEVLLQNSLPWPQVLATETEGNCVKFFISSSDESLKVVLDVVKKAKGFKSHQENLATVSATCFGSTNTNTSLKILNQFKKVSIEPLKMFFTPQSIAVLIESSKQDKAIQALHSLIV